MRSSPNRSIMHQIDQLEPPEAHPTARLVDESQDHLDPVTGNPVAHSAPFLARWKVAHQIVPATVLAQIEADRIRPQGGEMDQVTDGTSQGDGTRMLIEVEFIGSAPRLPNLEVIKFVLRCCWSMLYKYCVTGIITILLEFLMLTFELKYDCAIECLISLSSLAIFLYIYTGNLCQHTRPADSVSNIIFVEWRTTT